MLPLVTDAIWLRYVLVAGNFTYVCLRLVYNVIYKACCQDNLVSIALE